MEQVGDNEATAVADCSAILTEAEPSHTFEDLPTHRLVDGEMVEITYSVDEVEVVGYTTETGDLTSDGIIGITNTQDKTQITVTKSWENADGTTTWPEGLTVDVQLMEKVGDGEATAVANGSATLTEEEPEHTFINLPTHKLVDGEMVEIEYSVVEEEIVGYTTAMGALTSDGIIGITNTQDTTEITVTKSWVNEDGSETWPEGIEVEVQLMEQVGDGEATAVANGSATLTEEEPEHTFSNLPTHKPVDGEMVEITYSVDEVDVAGYSSAVSALADNIITVTNTQKTLDKQEYDYITINKLDEAGTALSGAVFGLYTDSACETEAVATYTDQNFRISTEDEILESFLPEADGESITLYLKEIQAPAIYLLDETIHTVVITTSISEREYDETEDAFVQNTSYTITIDGLETRDIANTPKSGQVAPEITKKMEGPNAAEAPDNDYVFRIAAVSAKDGNDEDITPIPMPESDTTVIHLTRGTLTGDGTFGEITYSTPGTYVYEITEVPADMIGMTYSQEKVTVTVTVTEEPDCLKAEVSYADNERTLVNQYELPDKTSATVKKVWEDEGNRDGLRPVSLRLELLADGQSTGKYVTLNAENGWIGALRDLPKCDGDREIVYTWKEPNVSGYTLTDSSRNGTLTTLTNTHTPEETTVRVRKIWEDNGNTEGKRPAGITVQLYADGIALGSPVRLDESNGWQYEWTGLSKHTNPDGRTGTQSEIAYTVAETEVPEGYVMTVTGNASTGFVITNKLERGRLILQKEFDIKREDEEPEDEETTEIEVVKIWEDEDNLDGNRPESITVRLYAGGEEVRVATLNAANGWRRKFVDLPKFVDGHPIHYSVKEDPVEWYVAEIDGFTITNRYQPELTSVSVRKVWNDEDNRLNMRPVSIRMTLSNGMSVVLNEANGWFATITGLPARINGQPAVYTWIEQEIIGYERESVSTQGSVTTFTNRLWSRPESPTQGGTPRTAGDATYIFEDYDTPLGVEVVINHVGDCFD